MDKALNIEDKSHASDVLARLDRFRKNQQYCDFKIKCGGQEIPVHKCLVTASSDYFDAMLSHNTIEKRNGVVELKEIDRESVVKCVDFMYTGKAVVSEEKQVGLIHVASILQLHQLCYQIGDTMKANMDVKSFFTIRKIAMLYGLEALSETCAQFAAENFCSLMKMDEFRDLEAKCLESLIVSPYLNLIADVKCKALMNWIENDSNRVEPLFDLMKLVDISKVRVSYRKFLLDVPIIFNSPQCLEYIRRTIPDENDEEAADYSGDNCLKILSCNHVTCNIECFGLEDDSWSKFCSIDKSVHGQHIGLVTHDNNLYLATLVCDITSLFRLNFVDKSATWEKLSSPNHSYSYDSQSAILNGNLYLCEGKYLERYNFTNDRWSEIHAWTSSRLCVGEGCMTAANGKLVMVCRDWGPDQVYRGSEAAYYDPSTSTVSPLSSLHRGRTNASACAHMNVVYVFGGMNEVTEEYYESVEILYSIDSQWELVTLPTLQRSHLLSYCFNGKIYLAGGYVPPMSSSNQDQSAVVFDLTTKSLLSEYVVLPARSCQCEDCSSVMVVL